MDHLIDEDDARFLRQAFALSRFAKARGNGPYGALLVRSRSVVLEAENIENEPKGDLTCHAETVLLRRALKEFTPAELGEMTLYASTEPCPMCAGAIALVGLPRVIFGASSERAAERTGSSFVMDCRGILSKLSPATEVIGPALESEALKCL